MTRAVNNGEPVVMHYGVKGQKWGVRKSRESGPVRRGAAKANAALDAGRNVIKEGEKKLIFLPQAKRSQAALRTQTRVLGSAVALNRSPQFKGKDLKKDPELKAAYIKQLEGKAKKIYAEELDIARTEAWGDVLGVDTNGVATQMRISAARNRISHADDDERETLLVLNLTTDELGQVIGVVADAKYLEHQSDDTHLMHQNVENLNPSTLAVGENYISAFAKTKGVS